MANDMSAPNTGGGNGSTHMNLAPEVAERFGTEDKSADLPPIFNSGASDAGTPSTTPPSTTSPAPQADASAPAGSGQVPGATAPSSGSDTQSGGQEGGQLGGAYDGMRRTPGSENGTSPTPAHPSDAAPFTPKNHTDYVPSDNRHVGGFDPTLKNSTVPTEVVDYKPTQTPDYDYRSTYDKQASDEALSKVHGPVTDPASGRPIPLDKAQKPEATAYNDYFSDKGKAASSEGKYTLSGTESNRDSAYAESLQRAKDAVKDGARSPEEVSKAIKDVSGVELSDDAMKNLWKDTRDNDVVGDAMGGSYAGGSSGGAYVIGGWTFDANFDPSIIDREMDVNRHCQYLGISGSAARAGAAMPYTFEGTSQQVNAVAEGLLSLREGIGASLEGSDSNAVGYLREATSALTDALDYYASGAGIQQVTEAMDAPVQTVNSAIMGVNSEGMDFLAQYEVAAPVIALLHAEGINPAGVPGIMPNAGVDALVSAALEAGNAGGANMATVLTDAMEVAEQKSGGSISAKDLTESPSDSKQAPEDTSEKSKEGQVTTTPSAGGGGGGGGGFVGGGGGGGGYAMAPRGGGFAGGGSGVGGVGGATATSPGGRPGASEGDLRDTAEKIADQILGDKGKDKDDDDKELTEEEKKKKAADRLDEIMKEHGLEVEDSDSDSESSKRRALDDDFGSDDDDVIDTLDERHPEELDAAREKAADAAAGRVGDIDTDLGSGAGSAPGSSRFDGTSPTDAADDLKNRISPTSQASPISPDGSATHPDSGSELSSSAVPGTDTGSSATGGAPLEDPAQYRNPNEDEQEDLAKKLNDATHLTSGSANASGLRDSLSAPPSSGSGMGAGGLSTREGAGAGAGAGAAGAAGGAPMMGGAAGAAGAAGGAGPAGAAGARPGQAGHTAAANQQAAQNSANDAANQQAEREAQEREHKRAMLNDITGQASENIRNMGASSAAEAQELLNNLPGVDSGVGNSGFSAGSSGSSLLPEGGWKNYGEYLPDPFQAEKGDIVASPQGDGVYDGEGNVEMEDGRKIPINQLLHLAPPEYGVFRPEADAASSSMVDEAMDNVAKNHGFSSADYAQAAAGGGVDSAAQADPFASGGEPSTAASHGFAGSDSAQADPLAAQDNPQATQQTATTGGDTSPAAPSQPSGISTPASSPVPESAPSAEPQHVASTTPSAPTPTQNFVDVDARGAEAGHDTGEPSRNNTGTGFADRSHTTTAMSSAAAEPAHTPTHTPAPAPEPTHADQVHHNHTPSAAASHAAAPASAPTQAVASEPVHHSPMSSSHVASEPVHHSGPQHVASDAGSHHAGGPQHVAAESHGHGVTHASSGGSSPQETVAAEPASRAHGREFVESESSAAADERTKDTQQRPQADKSRGFDGAGIQEVAYEGRPLG